MTVSTAVNLPTRKGAPKVLVDVPALVGQFLNDLRNVDIIVELLQNELDAQSSNTTISFGRDALICEGDGAPIDRAGWNRLTHILGAGGDVAAKLDGIGAKNHGLRAAFRFADLITVQSAGHRIDLTARGDEENPDNFYPAVWPKERDPSAPSHGTRVIIPYRKRPIEIPSGERFVLPAPTEADIRDLAVVAAAQIPSRFVAASAPGRKWQYRLAIQSDFAPNTVYTFRCEPLRGRFSGLFRRTCTMRQGGGSAKVIERRIGAAFETPLSETDHGRVPKVFRRGHTVVGELNWRVDKEDRPVSRAGALAYPIQYPVEHVSTGHGFDISGPFISSQSRHGISEDERNQRIIQNATRAFADLVRSKLASLFGLNIWRLFASKLPDLSREDALLQELLRARSLPVSSIRKRSGAHAVQLWAQTSNTIVLATPSYDPTRIDRELTGLCKGEALHPESPPALVAALLRAHSEGGPQSLIDRIRNETGGQASISFFTECTAAERILIEAPSIAEAGDFEQWVQRCGIVLSALERARQNGSLPSDLTKRLKKEGRLPTQNGPAEWGHVRRSRSAVPEIPGIMPPPIIHTKLAKLPLISAGALRLPAFDIDEFVSTKNSSNVVSAGRERFFSWLRSNYRMLKGRTLSTIAGYPIWPGRDGVYRSLGDYCFPRSHLLRAILPEVLPEPAESVISFSGFRKSGRGGISLRSEPTVGELQQWHRSRMEKIKKVLSEGRSDDAIELVRDTEDALDRLRKNEDVSMKVFAHEHRTFSRANVLEAVVLLHANTREVQACRLISDDLIAGDFESLYRSLGAHLAPTASAVIRALRADPAHDVLFSRLEAFRATGSDLSELSGEPMIMVHDNWRAPDRLTFPGAVDYWGQWKTPIRNLTLTPERAFLLEKAGVVRQSLREDLSSQFFQWLGASSAAMQRVHLQQILRHWRDRRHGVLGWVHENPDVNCIPVRGRDADFELVSLRQAQNPRRAIFLPDFYEIQDEVSRAVPRVRLAITDAKGVNDSVMDVMSEIGVRSLRKAAGEPVRILTDGELERDSELDGLFATLTSTRVLKTLPHRLPRFEIQRSWLKHTWKQQLRSLKGARVAEGLTAQYELLSGSYSIPVASGIDLSTGLICVDTRADRRLAFYDTLAKHLFRDGASQLWAYGLLRAVESQQDVTLFDFRGDEIEQEGEEEDSETPSETEIPAQTLQTEQPAPKKAHGVATRAFEPAVPNPTQLGAINNPTSLIVRHNRAVVRTRPSSTDVLRHTVEEEEQKLQLKRDHYGWHCQACLGQYDANDVTPPNSYIYLPHFRKGLIEAHHVEHLQNKGRIGAGNLLILCKFHHDYLGDRLSGELVRVALEGAKTAIRQFPINTDATEFAAQPGLLTELQLDNGARPLRIYFSHEHARAWREVIRDGQNNASADSTRND
ncbi:MAG TPA: hypothetical protein VFW28_18260 [Micropepsaceae bacterium]|nr:hypothetical protein [Micropepsaceae bacterium]